MVNGTSNNEAQLLKDQTLNMYPILIYIYPHIRP